MTTEYAEETEESQQYLIVFFVWFVSFVVTNHAGYALENTADYEDGSCQA